MDELTRERYQFELPEWETRRRARPRIQPVSREDALLHRFVLCGTADLGVSMGGTVNPTAVRNRRLIRVIRRTAGVSRPWRPFKTSVPAIRVAR